MGMFRKPGGGGFLNGVDGEIVGYKFESTTFEGKKGAYDALSVALTIRPDGAKEPVQQFLPAGFLYDNVTISEDGLSLESEDERTILTDDTEFAAFLQSMIDAGFTGFAEDHNGRNFEEIIGQRVTFKKAINEARQMASGRKKLGSKAKTSTPEEIMAAGRRQDKKDKTKFYNQDMLLVSAILAPAEKKAAAKKGAAASKTAKPAAAAKGKAKAAPAESDAPDAGELLKAILRAAKDNAVNRASLSSLIVRKALTDGIDAATREELRKLICSEEFLATEDGWVYDGSVKTQPVVLA